MGARHPRTCARDRDGQHGRQLQTKTWPEIAKWFNLLICRALVRALPPPRLRVPKHKETWRADQ